MPVHECPFRTATGIGVFSVSAFVGFLVACLFKIYINNEVQSRGVSKNV